MDPENNLQDIVRCTICVTLEASMYCAICDAKLCKDCIEEHVSDKLKDHKVMLLKHKRLTPTYRRCEKHSQEHYELICQKCLSLFCKQCIPCNKKEEHKIVHILEEFNTKKEILKEDLAELKNIIYPEYEKIALKITYKKIDIEENSQKLKTALDKHGDYLRREIDMVIDKLKSDLDNTTSEHMVILKKEEDKITQTIFEIKETIEYIQNTLKANDICNISVFKSRNAEFRKLPHSLKVSLPTFTPKKISNEQMLQQFGSLSKLFLKKELLDKPTHIKTIKTDDLLFNVTCLRDEAIWTSGRDRLIRLYNLHGEEVKTIETKSEPYDIEVTRSGDLVYTDYDARTVNIVKDTQVQSVIKRGLIRTWRPLGVCNTYVDELLVVMVNDDNTQTKVVRYSGSTEKQSIQYNENGEPLYTSNNSRKYISENRNLDICVSDIEARAVVVVDQAGKLRFTYIGTPNTNKREFHPRGITTDSQGQILTADYNNDCIHIVNQDGQFLCYIDVCVLREPFGLCIDTSDNLFVAKNTGEVEKIQYYR